MTPIKNQDAMMLTLRRLVPLGRGQGLKGRAGECNSIIVAGHLVDYVPTKYE